MGIFDDRKKGQEAKFFHDEETRFRATARRNKLLGLWVAEQLGKSGADAESYAKDVVKADMEEAGDDDVIRKVLGDLKAKGVNLGEAAIKAKLEELMPVALEQVKGEKK